VFNSESGETEVSQERKRISKKGGEKSTSDTQRTGAMKGVSGIQPRSSEKRSDYKETAPLEEKDLEGTREVNQNKG